MKVTILDFTGKAEFYNDGLIKGLKNSNQVDYNFISPKNKKVLGKFNNSSLRVILIPFYVIYTYLKFIFTSQHLNIHFQWLPFELYKLDLYFLKILKRKNHRLILTVHNILPHDSGLKYLNYNNKIYKIFDNLITHDNIAKNDLFYNFNIQLTKIKTANIGVEISKLKINQWGDKKDQIVIFGHIKPYKGTSDFIQNIWKYIDNKTNYNLVIVGKFDITEKKNILSNINKLNINRIKIIDKRISDKKLYDILNDSKFCVFPYKKITGSAALLTAMSFGIPCICSKLGLFVEYNKYYGIPFLYTNHLDFNKLIENFDESYYNKVQKKSIDIISSDFNWNKIAKKHCQIYLNG